MLALGQLRQKKGQAATCLESRKRKLCSLYDATYNATNEPLPEQIQLEYNARLQAFLDANDLTIGLAFTEATLPALRTNHQPQPPQHDVEGSSNHSNSTKSTKKSITRSRASTPQSPSIFSSPTRLDGKALSKQKPNGVVKSPKDNKSEEDDDTAVSNKDQENVTDPDNVGVVADSPQEVIVNDHPPATVGPTTDEKQNNLPVTPPPDSVHVDVSQELPQFNNIESTQSSPPPHSKTRKTSEPHLVIPSPSRRSKSPLSLGPVKTNVDPQSSPASTNGAASATTPAPTAGSPSTSPGDEEPPTDLQDFQASKAGNDLTPPNSTDAEMLKSPPETTSDAVDVSTAIGDTVISGEKTQEPDSSLQSSILISTSQKPAKDPEFQRPAMRIDTQSSTSSFDAKSRMTSGLVESPSLMTGTSTPRKIPTSTYPSQDQPKRATRISSGALGRKSVSEILGETPKPMSPQVERTLLMTPSSATRDEFTLATSAARLAERAERDRREKETRERSRLSTVVFAKPQQPVDSPVTTELVHKSPGQGNVLLKERDYLYTLFESRAYNSRGNNSLTALLSGAHKTLSTTDHLVEYQEQMNCRTLKRIYQLQNANRWPLRQIKRAEEMPRATSHWDFLLDHAKWLRTDFREERKWKTAAAKGVAEWCAEWVNTTDRQARKALQVRIKRHQPLPARDEADDTVMENQHGSALSVSGSTPELIHTAEDESVSDGMLEDPREVQFSNAPAAIFSLGPSDFNFIVEKTPAAEKLLNELPLYEPAGIEPDMELSDLAERMDARWMKDLLPISKFAEGKVRVKRPQAPMKRSRYDYELEDSPRKQSVSLPPEQKNVALFMPENKHTRDRIHPGHSFRPPSEYPMPTQSFFESRHSSQWTHAEEDELKKLVRDYSYNWSLISSCLSPKSLFASGADRRTPWECFERWVGLEGLPADMSKTPYFRAYHSRIDAAGRHLQAQLEAAQRQAGNNAQIVPRRRTTQPVRVEKKRTQRYLAMVDAMRKLAKKRETAVQKQQHAADLAAMRKVNESNQPKPPFRTPADFSKLKHERELRSAERQEAYRQQVLAQRQFAATQARQGGQINGAPANMPRLNTGVPNGVPNVNGMPNLPNGNVAGLPNGQQRPQPVMSSGPNGMSQIPQNLRGGQPMTQAQIQAQAQLVAAQRNLSGQGHSPEQIRAHTEAIKAQQQALLMARQQAQVQAQQAGSQNGNHSSPNMPNATMGNGNPANVPYLAALAASNGAPSPSVPGNGNAGSPRANTAQALSSGHVPAIQQMIASIRTQHPGISDGDAQRVATEQMMNWQAMNQAGNQKHRNQAAFNQAALNAAAGAINAGANASNAAAAYAQNQTPMMSNEAVQQYNQRMRQMQQAQQAQQRMPPGMSGMMAGMTGSPVLNMARPVSQHGQMSRSATPRDQRSGSQGGMNGPPGQGSPRNGQLQMQT